VTRRAAIVAVRPARLRRSGSGQDEPMTRPGVVFDVDGTLVDTNWFHAVSWWRAFRRHGHVVPMADLHRLIGMGSGRLITEILGRDDDAINDTYSDEYHRFSDEIVAFDAAADLLRMIARGGAAVALATSAKPEDVDTMLDRFGAGDGVICHVTSSGDADESKPAPDIFQLAVEGAGIDASQAIVVGDTVWDVQAATKAGLPCICVTSGGIAEAELRDAGAIAVYDNVRHLLTDLDASPIASLLHSSR
jgi:HAD superfamily hydrolase (TIGR01509 family)